VSALPRIAAIGAGRMGRGIGHVFAYAGFPVEIIDLKPREPAAAAKLAAEAKAEVAENLQSLIALGVMSADQAPSILDRIAVVTADAAPAALARADVIFEGVTETMEAKRDAFARACAHARPDAIIASTTSTILVDTLAGFVTHPERFLNTHYLNPAYLVPLVEISPGKATDPAVTARMKALLEQAGKVPVLCAASPGFIVPRIQSVAMAEAARIVGEGLATAEDVDKATRYGFGFRFAVLGLVEFLDYGGNDIMYHASRYLNRTLNSDRYAAPKNVDDLYEAGKLGLKSGLGFYDYSKMDVEAYKRDVITRFIAQLNHMGMVKPPGGAL